MIVLCQTTWHHIPEDIHLSIHSAALIELRVIKLNVQLATYFPVAYDEPDEDSTI
jgi:hypothetical protein